MLSTFSQVYGIGPTKARELYERGLRTLGELDILYGVDDDENEFTANAEPDPIRSGLMMRHDLGIKCVITLHSDVATRTLTVCGRIPRQEVEEIAAAVSKELEAIQSGFIHTIVGGYVRELGSRTDVRAETLMIRYRRGKQDSNDLDIVYTHPQLRKELIHQVAEVLVERLRNQGSPVSFERSGSTE